MSLENALTSKIANNKNVQLGCTSIYNAHLFIYFNGMPTTYRQGLLMYRSVGVIDAWVHD